MMTGHIEPSLLATSSPVCIQSGDNKAGVKDQGAAATAATPGKTTDSYILTCEASPLFTPTTSTPGMGTAATAATSTAAATPSSSSTSKQQPPRKRRRIVISCTECHRRKQKCDRNLPCANCVSRNKQDACRYETAAPTARAAAAAQQQQQQQAQQSQQQRFRNSDGDSPRSAEARADAEPREQQRRRTSKYDLDPRLASSVQGDFMSRGSLDSAVSVSDAFSGVGGGVGDAHGAGSPVKPPTSFGYASASSASTLGFLKKLDDGSAPEDALANFATARENTAYFGTRERYKSLVRQLPARPYIEKLVEIYFKDFHWQYNAFDRYVFDRQMEEWYALPFNALNCEGPQALSPDLRAFPALVFQVIATSLLMLGTDSDPTFESLKYNTSMTFEDLANDYTESGVALLSLLGKRQISLTFVAADWVRAGFLKYSGLVTESWHAIGAAIRDAQECGLHRESLDPLPKSNRLEDILENQWEKQRRRNMWCVLVVWDVHTGIVLGRPLSVDYSVEYPLPIDAPEPKDPSRTPVVQRSEGDPPNKMTRMLYAHKITMTLKEITDLEKEGPCPKDFSKVDRLHEKLIELDAQTPAVFRRENPDTRYDNLPECFWVPKARMALHPLVAFNFMALHRPYVFTRPHSRREALKASLKMLELQKASFSSLNPRFYKLYHLFFGTFDAIVLMASIFILFPKENDEYVTSALQHFQWAMERFDIMSTRNRLAAAARGVLQAIHLRLKRALGFNGPASIGTTPGPWVPAISQAATCSTTGGESHNGSGSGSGTAITGTSPSAATSGSVSGSGSSNNETYSMSSTLTTPGAETTSSSFISEYHIPALTHDGGGAQTQTQTHPHSHALSMATGLGGSGSGGGGGLAANEWSLPDGFDWASIQPVHAMADVAYNDLMGISNSGNGNGTAAVATAVPMPMPNWAGGTPLLNEAPTTVPDGSGGGAESSSLDATQEWLFEGDFGNDSVWNLLNQYPAPS